MPEAGELFHQDVPVLRTSLARHGLVDLPSSPPSRRSSLEPPSSQDLTAADRGEEQWGAAATAATAGSAAGFKALVGVDSVVVGHVRAAEELRATLLYAPSSKDSPKTRQSAPSRRDRPTSHREGALLKQRPGSSRTSFPPSQREAAASGPSKTQAQQRASSTASKAAASAMAAVRKGDRPFYMGAAGWASRSQKAPQPAAAGVSMANLLDIAVSLFGSGGTRSGGGADKRGSKGEKLVTFTVDVHAGTSTTLGVTVKEMGGGAVYVEDVRKLPNGCSGPAELAGILVGDVILGINYKPLEKGLVHTSALLAEAIALAGFVKLQISRAVRSSGWRQVLPGKDCPIVTELMWRTAQLRKAGILSSSERYTIAALILQRMAWEEGTLAGPPRAQAPLSPPVALPLESAASDLMDSLVLHVKGLREAISVRCLHAKSMVEAAEVSSMWGPPTAGEEGPDSTASSPTPEAGGVPATSSLTTVRYILRAEDIGTGREWLVFPQFSDFSELRRELLSIWPPIADLPFPAKRPLPRVVARGSSQPGAAGSRAVGKVAEHVIEDGVVKLEAFLEGAMALLCIYASIDARCSGALRVIQDFLGRPQDLVNAEMALSPALCDQKRAELLLYKLLNQVDSPAARMKILLMRDFENEMSQAQDVESLMKGASSRLRRLQDFVLEKHEERLSSSTYATGGARETTMRKAVRRQVELSFYLPLRRCLWKELARRLHGPARKLSRAIKVLRHSSPAVFGVENPGILASKEWGPVKEAMGQATRRVLPTDQIDGLRRAAEHIAALHASLQQTARDASGSDDSVDQRSARGGKPNGSVDGGRNDDAERASRRAPLARGEEEDGGTAANAANGGNAGIGRSSPKRGGTSSGGGGDGGGGAAVERKVVAFPDNGMRETREDYFGAGNGDSGGVTTAVTCGEPEAPSRVSASPSPMRANGHDKATGKVGGGPETKAAADARGAVDRSCRGPESGRNGDGVAAAAEFQAAAEDETTGGVPSRSEHEDGSGGTSAPSPPLEKWSTTPDGRPASRGEGLASSDSDAFVELGEREQGRGQEAVAVGDAEAAGSTESDEAMGADDFLPLFALVLVHSAPSDLLLSQTLLTHLMDLDGSLSEAGYLVATLEAAVSFITQIYSSSSLSTDKQDSPLPPL